MRFAWLAIPITILGAVLTVSGADWPHFGGPNSSGVSDEKGLATSWPADGPKVLWKVDLAAGFGGAAVRDGKVYVMDHTASGQDVVICLDLADGKELWRFGYDAPGKVDYPGPRATPTVDDEFVFTVGAFGELCCTSLKTHTGVWHHNIVKEFAGERARWGVAQSPCVYKDLVIVAPQSPKASLAAFDKKTGQPRWTSKATGPMSYASPLVVNVGGMDQIVMLTCGVPAPGDPRPDPRKRDAPVTIFGADPKDGEILWHYEKFRCWIPIPSVTDMGGGKFFITGGYAAGARIFQVQQKDGKWVVEDVMATRECESQMHNGLLWENYIYANSASNGRGVICMDLEGKLKWSQRGLTDNGGAVLIADGMLYIMGGNDGTLYLAKASPDGYKELAKAKVLDGQQVWAPMALSDGKLLVRDQKQLKCLDVKAK
jgi:outer membrane protein assembly factor BamB